MKNYFFLIPKDVDRRPSSPTICRINHVVVNQSRRMDHFNNHCDFSLLQFYGPIFFGNKCIRVFVNLYNNFVAYDEF